MINLKKIRNSLFIVFNIVFILTIGITLHFALFNPFDRKLSKPTIFFLFLVLSSIFIFICFILNKLSKKQLIIISCANLIIFIFLQLSFGYFFAINPSWDINFIYDTASKFALDKINVFPEYFTVLYPNNIFVTVLWSIFYKICHSIGVSFIPSSILLNILIVLTSVILTYFIILKIFNIKVATISSFIFLIITPFYTYSPIFYTDTLTMIFLPLAFIFMYKYKTSQKYIFVVLSGLTIAFGTGIKTNIVIGFIALIIYLFLIINDFKKLLKILSTLIISFLLCSTLINFTCQKYIDTPLKTAGFPYTHWIMMGLTGIGGYNQDEVNASKNAGPNKDDIKQFNISVIKSRLNNYGVDGYIKFLYKKLKYTWGDGTYFASELLSRKPINPTEFHSYIYGEKSNFFKSFSEASHSLFLLLILVGSLSLFKLKNKVGFLFNICIFGTFLFLILWETKSRYLVCILPLFVCSCALGINYILDKIHFYTLNNKSNNIL
ncbi:glycosyltransferase family 39 protein [Clostridium thermobutyricum]|uniref:glycosyltransferase family 39 protein n=1 Tax=Clostridium thermobutyricum TaxID=29372 RepID=UPI003F528C74